MPDSAVGVAVTVALSAISLYCGMAAAGAQQDRETIRRQRGAAKALLADLDRIDDELDRMKNTGLVPSTGKPPVSAPKIHPWVEGLIAQIADDAPDVVSDFMRLERSLAILAQTAETARATYALVEKTFDAFQQLEETRRTEFERGTYDPLSDSFSRPGKDDSFRELPEDSDELASIAAAGERLTSQAAVAKLALTDARRSAARAMDDYHWQPRESVTFLIKLQERLYPIAVREIPTLPQLVLKTAVPLHEDAQLDELARSEALREFRSGTRRV